MLNKPLAIVDVETTGINGKWDRIIEIGVIRIEDDRIVNNLDMLINPQTYVSPFIESFTGIKAENLFEAPTFYEVKDQIHDILSDAVLVAHNARFDYSFLKSEFRRAGIVFNAKTLCTAKLSRRLFPRFRHHNLSAIIERFNLKYQRRHRAYDDAFVLWQFIQNIRQTFSEKKLTEAVKKITRANYTGDEKIRMQIEELPEAAGVYIFYDENNLPLYVGKSKNIKDRVIAHYSSDYQSSRGLQLSKSTKRIEHIQTAGELGALIQESLLIKKLLPIFNRSLRRKKQLVALSKITLPDGFLSFKLEVVDSLVNSDFTDLFGVFKNKRSAIEGVGQIAKKYRLCSKLLGIEKTKASCFEYKLGRCRGACIGEEKPQRYNLRFILAYTENKQFRPWPFDGPIEIVEKTEENDLFESFVIDKWCLLNKTFDLDTYKIISSFLRYKKTNYRVLSRIAETT